MASIGVVGAGIMGLSSALAIQQRLPSAKVTIAGSLLDIAGSVLISRVKGSRFVPGQYR